MKFTISPKAALVATMLLVLLASGWCDSSSTPSAAGSAVPSASTTKGASGSSVSTTPGSKTTGTTGKNPPAATPTKSSAPGVATVSQTTLLLAMCGAMMALVKMSA